jgi:hypothetical protein
MKIGDGRVYPMAATLVLVEYGKDTTDSHAEHIIQHSEKGAQETCWDTVYDMQHILI